jgi:hypothetical protein
MIPKIHKNPIEGRPIVASYNWLTTKVSILVSECLKENVKYFNTILPDTLTLVKSLETQKFPLDCCLFTLDVKALYTNIPIDWAIESITFEMYPSIHSKKILDCLEFVLKHNLMKFKDRFFLQLFGIAMGTSLAPILANLVLAILEHKMKISHSGDKNLIWPKLYKRFIDDILGIIQRTIKDIEYFIKIFNSMVPSIQVSLQMAGDKVNYLDLVIFKGERFLNSGLLDLDIYQKPLNIYSYFPYHSGHPFQVKVNFV